MGRLVLVRREQAIRGGQPLAFLIGLITALSIGILLLVLSGHDPMAVYERMFDSSIGSPKSCP